MDGLLVDGIPVPDTRDPLKALDAILQASGKGFYVMKDFPTSPGGRPEIVRRLRDLYRGLKDRGRHVLLVSPRMVIPEDAKKEIYVIEYELPDEGEIVRIIDGITRRRSSIEGLDDPAVKRLAMAMRGLTADEIGHLLTKVFASRKTFDDVAFLEILAEKEQMSKKEGVLEFVPPRFTIEDIGGYETLKTWLRKRKALFSKEALDAGIPIPKGLLLMGISGCGKSLCVKTISSLWNLPLFRLDMNAVFGTWMLVRNTAFRSAALLSNLRIVSFSGKTTEGGGSFIAIISLVIRFVPSLSAWTKALPSGSFIRRSHSRSLRLRGIESSSVVLRSKHFGRSTVC